MDNDCRRSGSGDPVTATHTARLVHQQCNCQVDRLCWQAAVTENSAIVAIQGMLIEAFPDQQPRLLATLTLVLQDRLDTALEAL